MTGLAWIAGRTTVLRPTGEVGQQRTGGLPRLGFRSAGLLLITCLLGVVGFGWPFLAGSQPGPSAGSHRQDAVWLISAVTLLVLAMVLAALLDGGTDVKAVALLGVLAAVGAALRPLGAGAAGIEPMFVVLILGGRVLGPVMGFSLGSTAMLASALLTAGVGPWLPFQMLAAAWVAMGAGLLPSRVRGRGEIAMLAGYALLAGFAFGAVMNLWFWPFAVSPDLPFGYRPEAGVGANAHRYLTFYLATSLGWDLPRGLLNAFLVLVAGPRLVAALRRGVQQAAFGVAVTFRPASTPNVPRSSPDLAKLICPG